MAIAVGDVLMLQDADTGASAKRVTRPCVVLALSPAIVVVVPRSASHKGLVPTPETASPGFNKPGSFSRWRVRVARQIAEGAINHGQLAEPYLAEVLALQRRRSQ